MIEIKTHKCSKSSPVPPKDITINFDGKNWNWLLEIQSDTSDRKNVVAIALTVFFCPVCGSFLKNSEMNV